MKKLFTLFLIIFCLLPFIGGCSQETKAPNEPPVIEPGGSESSKEEENIIVKLIELTKNLKTAYEEKNTGVICDYLFNLCNLYNKFYSEHNIVNEENEEVKSSWIALSKLVYNVIEKLLDILAIEVPDRM